MKFKGLNENQVKDLLPDNLILLGYRGSVVHGTYIKNKDPHGIDDKDIMGVYVHSLSHYFGFSKRTTKERFINEWDAVHYELSKYVNLLLKSNPNVMSLLWIPENYIIYKDEYGKLLRDNKDLFVSKKAYHSFSGYAHGQLKRMTNFACQGYMGEKRKILVEKYGYDTKNAAHLIRLLRMGIEFLNEGKLYVQRSDAQELIRIKKGEYSLDTIKRMADNLFEQALIAYQESTLPNEPDYLAAQNLVQRIILDYFQLKQDRKVKFGREI